MNQSWTPEDGAASGDAGAARPQWTFYRARERFPDFAAAWDELNERLYKSHPFLDSCFVGPCVEHFATAKDLLAVYGPPQRQEGMALLTQTRPGVSRTFLPAQAQIAPVLIDSTANARCLLHALPSYNIWLDFLCQDPDYSCFSPEREEDTCDHLEHTVTTRVGLRGEFDAYWTARSKNLRQNIRKNYRQVAKDGKELRLEAVTDPERLVEALRRFGELESSSWKGHAGTAVHWRNAQGRFYDDVLQRFARKGQATIYELYCDEELAAALMTIASNSMLVLLKTTFDASLARYSPGWLIIHEILKKEFQEKRFGAVEFYTNASPIMLSWATATRTIEHITVYRGAWCKQAAALGRRGRDIIGHLRDVGRKDREISDWE